MKEYAIPINLPSSPSDLALSNIASISRLTECIDMTLGSTWPPLGRGFFCLILSTMALAILGVKLLMSIPWNTWRAASKFPLWNSSLPSKALASWSSFRREISKFNEEANCMNKLVSCNQIYFRKQEDPPHSSKIELLLEWIQLHLLGCLQILTPSLRSSTKDHWPKSPSWQVTPASEVALALRIWIALLNKHTASCPKMNLDSGDFTQKIWGNKITSLWFVSLVSA